MNQEKLTIEIFATALNHLLKYNTGIVVELNDLKVVVFKNDNTIGIHKCSENEDFINGETLLID